MVAAGSERESESWGRGFFPSRGRRVMIEREEGDWERDPAQKRKTNKKGTMV